MLSYKDNINFVLCDNVYIRLMSILFNKVSIKIDINAMFFEKMTFLTY